MPLDYVKISIAAAWVITAVLVGLAAGVTSAAGAIALGAFATLPALALFLLWNEPPQTLRSSGRQS